MPARIDVPGLPFPLEASGAPAPVAPVILDDGVRLTAGAGADLFLEPPRDRVPPPGRGTVDGADRR